jgi:hypothetical protein
MMRLYKAPARAVKSSGLRRERGGIQVDDDIEESVSDLYCLDGTGVESGVRIVEPGRCRVVITTDHRIERLKHVDE